ncbi:hypothetical protein D9619_005952 [Psilocybe cf. subviscida]|uniref:F-box domain-containing protein n=1 Tax=Psilocybe cf. subviscida TaxID=2480587 RepID=A0A8H5BX80_9AGAR|nr:hypothetical protein D9619_005952 [Psilocybe cf. subviscida]
MTIDSILDAATTLLTGLLLSAQSSPDALLPFEDIEERDFRELSMGPRVSCSHNSPQYHYGPVSIRNYLAGHAKKELRIKRRKDLPEWGDLFLKLPIEVKLLVLEQLHPIDLYHFSHTSKAMRSLIMAPNAAGVWKTAFLNYPELPYPPRRKSYASWAALIYGPGICGVCGRLGGLTDFAFLRRFCEPCMRTHYSYISALRDHNDVVVDPEHIVCKLVPRSYRYHGLRYTTSYHSNLNAQYLRKDFDAMMRKYSVIQLIVSRVDTEEVEVLKQEYEEYCRVLACQVQKINQCASQANNWAMDIYRWCSSEYDAAAREITARCKKRLQNQGHETVDLDTVQYSIMHLIRQEHVYKLTPRAFRNIRPMLETIVINRKVERLKTERRELIEQIYTDFQKQMKPPAWQFLPPACLAKDAEGFQDFLNAEFTVRGELEIKEAMSIFPAFVDSWTKTQKELIVGLLPDTNPNTNPDADSDAEADVPEAQIQSFEDKLKRLELAQTVIVCSDCRFKAQQGRALVGWDAVCRHMRTLVGGNMHPCAAYELEPHATATAVALVTCVGLDPATTTGEEMTRRDDRFMCGNCHLSTSRGVTGLNVYTWLECITHIVEIHQLGLGMHESPAWHLLTPTATQFVKEHEYTHPRPVSEIWGCNECDAHFSEQEKQSVVIEHVNVVHGIEDPIIGVHVIPDRRRSIRRRKPFRLGLDPAYEYRCLKCPKLGITKLWELQALTMHLLLQYGLIRYDNVHESNAGPTLPSSHKLADPIENKDWEKVDIIARTVPAFPAGTAANDEDEGASP